MKIKILKDFEIYHDGINLTYYKQGDEVDLTIAQADKLIELEVAEPIVEKMKTPVVENKAAEPVKAIRATKKKKK